MGTEPGRLYAAEPVLACSLCRFAQFVTVTPGGCLAFILLAVLCHFQACQKERARWLWSGAALMALALGCLAKQHAVLTPLIWVAVELSVVPSPTPFDRSPGRLVAALGRNWLDRRGVRRHGLVTSI